MKKSKMGAWLIFILLLIGISVSIILYFKGSRNLKIEDNTNKNVTNEEVIVK